MKRSFLLLVTVSVMLLAPVGKIQAAATVLILGDFEPGDTLIDFESIAGNVEITDQFSALGPTFSGGLFADTLYGPPFMGSAVTASNFQVSYPPFYNPVTVAFSGLITRMGFDAVTNDYDDMTIRTYRSGVLTGSFPFSTSLTPSFLGVGDLAGIDRIEFEASGPGFQAFAIDNFRFDGASGAIPAPGAILLGAVGAGLAGWLRRRGTI